MTKIRAWIARQWAQISTKIGAALTVVSAGLTQVTPQLTELNPTWAGYATKAGAVVGIALVIWNEDRGK